MQSKTIQGPRYPRKIGRFSTLLSKIGIGEIDNQRFRHVILTIVPRPSEDRLKIVSWCKECKRFKEFKEFKGLEKSTGTEKINVI